MTMMNRFFRICRADLHGALDRIEDQGLLLKQALRDMEAQQERLETALKQNQRLLEKTEQEHQTADAACRNMEQDLGLAVKKGKDDIARFLIRKLAGRKARAHALAESVRELQKESERLRDLYEERRAQHQALKARAENFFHRRAISEGPAASFMDASPADEPSAAEVELELMKLKEALLGAPREGAVT